MAEQLALEEGGPEHEHDQQQKQRIDDPKAKARASELRAKMKQASQEIAKDPARMREAEREGFAPQVRNFVRQDERERGQEKGRGAEKDEGLER